MAGMAGGFAAGYADTALKLQQLQQAKDQQDQALAVQKENLALQRDVLKGQESSRKLQDAVHLQTLLRLQKEFQDNAASNLAADKSTGARAPAPAAGEISQTTLPPSGAVSDPITVTPGTTSSVVDPTLPERAQPFNTPAYREYLAAIGRGERPTPPPGTTVVQGTMPAPPLASAPTRATPAPTPPAQAPLPPPAVPTATSTPAQQPQGERLSDQAIQYAQQANPQRRELGQVTQALAVLEQQRASLQKEPAATKAGAAYKQREAELNALHAELTARRTQLEGLLDPKSEEDQWFLDRNGMTRRDGQAIPGLVEREHVAFEAQKVTTTKQAEDTFKRSQPIQAVDDKHDYVDLATGEKVPATMPYGQVLDLIAQGKVKVYEQLNEGRGKAWGFGGVGQQANTLIAALEADGEYGQRLLPHAVQKLDGKVGAAVGAAGGALVGSVTGPGALATAGIGATLGYGAGTLLSEYLANAVRTPREQQYEQAKSQFINAVLRRESGAEVRDSEYEKADKRYFPQPGNGPEVIRQKAADRDQALKILEVEAGRPLAPPQPVPLAPRPTPAPQAPIPPGAAAPPGTYVPAPARSTD